MRNHRVLGPLLVVTAVLVSSCASDDDNGLGAPQTTTAPASTTTAAAPVSTDPAMLDKAKAAVLQPGDFPAGWEALPQEEGLDLEITWSDIMECLGVDTGQPALGIATSPTFQQGIATQARSTVVYTDEPSAQAIATALGGPGFTKCAKDAFFDDAKRSAPEGGRPTAVEVAPLEAAQLGQPTFSFRLTNTMNLDDLQVPITQDFLVFFKGGTLVRMVFLNPGGPFPQDLERSLVEKVVGRA